MLRIADPDLRGDLAIERLASDEIGVFEPPGLRLRIEVRFGKTAAGLANLAGPLRVCEKRQALFRDFLGASSSGAEVRCSARISIEGARGAGGY